MVHGLQITQSEVERWHERDTERRLGRDQLRGEVARTQYHLGLACMLRDPARGREARKVEMAYQWERPFVIDDSRYRRTFGEGPTPVDEAVAEPFRRGPRSDCAMPDGSGTAVVRTSEHE